MRHFRYWGSLTIAVSVVVVVFVSITSDNFSDLYPTISFSDEADDTVRVSIKSLLDTPFTLSQEDPRLHKAIVNDFSKPPSNESYQFDKKSFDLIVFGQQKMDFFVKQVYTWQSEAVLRVLQNKTNGVFIECGAFDGQFLSNTRALEVHHGWSGLLIEPHPDYYKKLLTRNRKAWAVNSCLSEHTYPHKITMKKNWVQSNPTKADMHHEDSVTVQCFPIYSILLAFNITKIDYFSLDVEAYELKVLKTIPWNKINITVISVEYPHIPEGKNALMKFMKQRKYKVLVDGSKLKVQQNHDVIFYRPDLVPPTINEAN